MVRKVVFNKYQNWNLLFNHLSHLFKKCLYVDLRFTSFWYMLFLKTWNWDCVWGCGIIFLNCQRVVSSLSRLQILLVYVTVVCYNIHDYYLLYCPSPSWFTISKIRAECVDLVVCYNQSILRECNRDFLLMNSIKLKCLYPWHEGHAVYVQWIARHTRCKQVLISKCVCG